MTRKRRDDEPDGPGIVRVRLIAADEFDAGFIARLIRDCPGVEITGKPEGRSGGRLYFTVRVTRDPAEAASGD